MKVPGRTAPHQLAVAYRGPHSLRGRVTLRAKIRHGARVVAATFMLAGEPLGTVTKAPWALDVDAGVLPDGPASLHVVAVDRLGRRSVSPAVDVRVRWDRDCRWHEDYVAAAGGSPTTS